MPYVGRIGDLSQTPFDNHGCPSCPHPCSGPALVGSPNVNVNNKPALRVGDSGVHSACCGPNQWTAQAGSSSVYINGKPAHRLGDVVKHCGGVGKLITASSNVNAGG
ncbi:MAG TPA: PAAR domain-containing protein [Gemmatimonadaceae bacterium]|jgi:uncharacterized Zn-binding protein involved in type VI secretion